jgi:hypothetical protein
VQAGCDYQFAGGFVIGLQGDDAATIVLGTAYTARETRSGWTIGVGAEHAFTNFLSGFVEYGYSDFGTREIAFTPQIAGLGPAFLDIKETRSVGRAGLDLRFGGYGASVAAKCRALAENRRDRPNPDAAVESESPRPPSREGQDRMPAAWVGSGRSCYRRIRLAMDFVMIQPKLLVRSFD